MATRGAQAAVTEHHARMLGDGIRAMGLSVSEAQQQALLDFLDLLLKWNRTYNLSGIRDPDAMLRLHLLDSLSLLGKIRPGETLLDVGTGAGLPGIPLAICHPDSHFILLDSNGKKTRFLFQAVTTLKLDNVQVVNSRIENFQSDRQIAIVVTRAFASLDRTVALLAQLFAADTRLIAMKGQYPESELEALPTGFTLSGSERVKIPGEAGERHLIEVARQQIGTP